VLITTPSYYGVCSDVPRLAEIAHARDLPLVSDDAWALAYKFHPELPPFALDVGADLAIGSVHKTASGFSQTSVISVKGSRIDTSRLSRVGAEFVTPYPPGIPLFVPGERITENIADYLKTGSADGIYVEGCVDQSLSSLRVVA
jgi:arginine/lysine/ornithine decarboxylase